MCLTSQDQAFWSDTNLEADKYGAHVMKYCDPKYYCGKGSTTNHMVPTALIPMPANDSFGSGTSVLFPDVQRQQVELWPISASGDDNGMPLIVYPVSDFLRTNEKLYCYFNKLLIQFFIDNYGNAMTDVSSPYTENASSVGSWASTASHFEITNIEWHLMTYTMMDDIKAKLMAQASGPGIEIPYSQTIWSNGNPFQTGSNLLTTTIDKRNINNLQKLLICFRRVPRYFRICNNRCLRPANW